MIIDSDQGLNRQKIREIIFNDPSKKQWLEAQTHPIIRQQIQQAVTTSTTTYCIAVIPLFNGTHHYDFIDRVCVIDIDPDAQMERVRQRDHNQPELIKKIMSAQMQRQQRLNMADDIIDNNHDIPHLINQVDQLHRLYCQLSGNQHANQN